jgi:hypothetical protein
MRLAYIGRSKEVSKDYSRRFQRVMTPRLGSRSHGHRAGTLLFIKRPNARPSDLDNFFCRGSFVFESRHFPFVGVLLVIAAFAISPPGRVCGATKINISG